MNEELLEEYRMCFLALHKKCEFFLVTKGDKNIKSSGLWKSEVKREKELIKKIDEEKL